MLAVKMYPVGVGNVLGFVSPMKCVKVLSFLPKLSYLCVLHKMVIGKLLYLEFH